MLTLPTNIDKAEIEAFVNHVTAEVMDGHVDPLSVHIRCKAVVKALEAIIERTEELAKDTAATYGKGEFKFHGSISSSLANTVNSAFDLSCSSLDSS